MKRSHLEIQLELQIIDAELPAPKIEYKFHPTRQFRFDFCWPEYMIAVEVEGGTHNGGRHVTATGFQDDCIKYNEAAYLGWKVLRFTSDMLNNFSAINFISKVVNEAKTKSSKK